MAEQDEYTFDEPEGFLVNSDMKAEWVLGKLRQDREQYDRLSRLADERIVELKEQKSKLDNDYERDSTWFKNLLIRYYRDLPAGAKNTTKTQRKYKLLSGDIIEKLPRVKFDRDDNVLLTWLKGNDFNQFIKTVETPMWNELKASTKVMGDSLVTDTGEIIPGVVVTMTETEYEIEVK